MVHQNASHSLRFLGWGPFLSGFVPGLLQWRLGQKQRAVLAFVSCTVLFFAGWMLVRERLFYWALLEPRTGGSDVLRAVARFGLSTALPELLNLPAHMLGGLLAWDGGPTGERLWRMPRDLEHLGAFLTGASGMLAAFWSAAGHWQLRLQRDGGDGAPAPTANPALCAGLSWLVPGLGHARAGQQGKGVLLGIAVTAVFALGLVVSGGHAVDRATASVWWIAQNLFGGGSLFAALFTGPLRMVGEPFDLQLGIVLCTVAGLMNLVVMVDAFTVAERSVFPLRRAQEAVA
ncbi:MAG: hypothetical protein JNM25_13145 [Planctomycetes bacterium]|nr:hypothetical protein [Planctomycetota bacterium]